MGDEASDPFQVLHQIALLRITEAQLDESSRGDIGLLGHDCGMLEGPQCVTFASLRPIRRHIALLLKSDMTVFNCSATGSLAGVI